MIDKKKIAKRLNKGSRLKELPLLNFYILVAILFQIIGELLSFYYFEIIRPLPIILMILYIHSKNSPRDHLVPTLTQIGLIISLIADLLLMAGEAQTFSLSLGFTTICHIVYIIAFRMGDEIRYLPNRYRLFRKLIYLTIMVVYSVKIYALWDKYPNHLLQIISATTTICEVIVVFSRYQITASLSFYFILIGVGLHVISENLNLCFRLYQIQTSLGEGLVMLTYFISHYFIMHGSLHQSNLQFEIDKIQDQIHRTY